MRIAVKLRVKCPSQLVAVTRLAVAENAARLRQSETLSDCCHNSLEYSFVSYIYLTAQREAIVFLLLLFFSFSFRHVLVQFLCNVQQYCDKINSHEKKEFTYMLLLTAFT